MILTIEKEGRVFQTEGRACAKALKQEGARSIDKPEKSVGKSTVSAGGEGGRISLLVKLWP